MIDEDEYLERIVAGIQAVSTSSAEVRWNEEINGRQFNVVVRFTLGTLRYLVLVEVRNRTRKATAEDLDAFVTKARDQNANKSVAVTVAGFQKGAISVAMRHGVDLFTISFDDTKMYLPASGAYVTLRRADAPKHAKPEFRLGEPAPIKVIEEATLHYSDGLIAVLPSERSQMSYYFLKTKLANGSSLHENLARTNLPDPDLNQSISAEHAFDPPIRVTPPDEFFFKSGEVRKISYVISLRLGREMLGNMSVDPNSLSCPVVYRNILTGEEARFPMETLPLGHEDVEAGKFYLRHPASYLFCDKIDDVIILWYLVESFQNGDLVQAIFTQERYYAPFYIAVNDKPTLARLNSRLDKLKSKQR